MMRALVLEGQLRLLDTVPDPAPKADQALLKIRRAGICNTDLELVRGYMNFQGIPGHEFVAEVIDGPETLIGRRVVGEINVAEGDCEFCRRGIPSQCIHRTTVGINRHPGAFSEYMALSVRNLVPVPDEVSDDAAVFVEPLAAALQIHEALHISPRDRIVLIGAGKLGMLVAQVLRLTGAHLQVVVRREKQAELLRRWSVTPVTLADVDPRSADVVVDCTGSADGFAASLDLVKARGSIVLKSTYTGIPQADLTRVAVDEIRVIGSRCGPFEAALRLMSQGLIDTESLIEARYPLAQALQAFEHAARPGAMKVLLDFD